MRNGSNYYQSRTQTGQTRSLWQSLQAIRRNVATFMIHRPEYALPSHDSPWSGYSCKARFYAYLDASEEQRDWLEKIYHGSDEEN